MVILGLEELVAASDFALFRGFWHCKMSTKLSTGVENACVW